MNSIMGRFQSIFSILVFSLLLISGSCNNSKNNNPVEPTKDEFKLGPITQYSVSSGKKTIVQDSITGGKFILSNGGTGTISVAKITSTNVSSPPDGQIFYIEYSGNEEMYLSYERTADKEPFVAIYSNPIFSMYESANEGNVWITIPPLDTTSSTALFQLYQPGEDLDIHSSLNLKSKTSMLSARKYYVYYTERTKYNAMFMRMEAIREIVNQMIPELIDSLPPSIQVTVKALVNGEMKLKKIGPSITQSGYVPWWYLRIRNPMLHPYIQFNTMLTNDYATESTAGHEVGHYISHCVMGDDNFYKFAKQSRRTHDLGWIQDGRYLIEEWAHYSDYMFNKLIGRTGINKIGYDIEELNNLIKWKQNEKFSTPQNNVNPRNLDWPRIEGFATGLLSRLHSTKKTIESHDIYGNQEEIPTIGLTHKQIYELLCKIPQTGDELYQNINNYLTNNDDNTKFRVIAEKCGWSYNINCRFVNKSGTALKGVNAQAMLKTSTDTYFLDKSSMETGEKGLFYLARTFPGNFTLRVSYNNKTFDIPLNNDYTKPTNEMLNKGDIVIDDSQVGQPQKFDYSWVLNQSIWPRFVVNFSLSGTVQGLEGNQILKITKSDFGNVNINISKSTGKFTITLKATASIAPSKLDTTYSDNSYDIIEILSEASFKTYTSGFPNYHFELTGNPTIQESGYGDIYIDGWWNSMSRSYDKNKKLTDSTSGPSTYPLFKVHMTNY